MRPQVLTLTLLLFIQSILFACATEMPGRDAMEITPSSGASSDIEVAVEFMDQYSSPFYQAYLVSFRNNTDQWVRFDRSNIAFPALNGLPTILLGSDLQTYLNSVNQRNAVNNRNKAIILGSLAVAGAAVGVTSNNQALASAGWLTSLGALTYSSIDNVLASKDRLEFQNALPESHFLKPIDIPPRLATSRWIIMHMGNYPAAHEIRVEVGEKGKDMRKFSVQREVVDPKPQRLRQ